MLEILPQDLFCYQLLRKLDVDSLLLLFRLSKKWHYRMKNMWKFMCEAVWNLDMLPQHYWYWLREDYSSQSLQTKTECFSSAQLKSIRPLTLWWRFVFFHLVKIWNGLLNTIRSFRRSPDGNNIVVKDGIAVAELIMYHYPLMGKIHPPLFFLLFIFFFCF